MQLFLFVTLSLFGIVISAEDWQKYNLDNQELVQFYKENSYYWLPSVPPENIGEENYAQVTPYILLKPNISLIAERHDSKIQVYKVKYSTDSLSRRLIPEQKYSALQSSNIFLGCSFTFGTGVNDNETFSYYFSKVRHQSNNYNLGIYGAGVNDILDDLNDFQRFKNIPTKKRNQVIYTVLNDHIERSLCKSKCYNTTYRKWVLNKSDYELDEATGQLANQGSFADRSSFKYRVLNFIGSFSVFKNLFIFSSEYSESDLQLFARMIKEIKDLSDKKLNADFYAVFYPAREKYDWSRVKKYLDLYKVNYVDMTDQNLREITNSRDVILFDGHPSKLGHYTYANLLDQKIPEKD